MGIAKGVNVISARERASSLTFFFIPSCLQKDPVGRANPEEVIINPPVIFKEYKLIPKNDKRNLPAKKEITKIINIFKEVLKAIFKIYCLVLPSVNCMKNGIVPSGLIIENKDPRLTRKRFIFIAKITCPFIK